LKESIQAREKANSLVAESDFKDGRYIETLVERHGTALMNIDQYGMELAFVFHEQLRSSYGAAVMTNAIVKELPSLNTAGMSLSQAVDGLSELAGRADFLRFLNPSDVAKIRTVIDMLQVISEQGAIDKKKIESEPWLQTIWETIPYFVVYHAADGKKVGAEALQLLLADVEKKHADQGAAFEDIEILKTFSFLADHTFTPRLSLLNLALIETYGGDAFKQSQLGGASSSSSASAGNTVARSRTIDGSRKAKKVKKTSNVQKEVDDAFD
jgi:hypothetical protein